MVAHDHVGVYGSGTWLESRAARLCFLQVQHTSQILFGLLGDKRSGPTLALAEQL